MINVYHKDGITYTTAAGERGLAQRGLINGCGITIRVLSVQELSAMMGRQIEPEPAADRRRLH